VLDKVIRAVEFLFGFTLAAGVVVLFAAVTATREERAREFAIMRAVGARSSLLRQVQRAELVGVGLLAGFLALLGASTRGGEGIPNSNTENHKDSPWRVLVCLGLFFGIFLLFPFPSPLPIAPSWLG
jgi:hypothetical protein